MTTKSQQKLMGQAYAYKTGKVKSKDLDPKYADEIKKLAKSMTEKQTFNESNLNDTAGAGNEPVLMDGVENSFDQDEWTW